jgi:D-glycerate 3-kinase
MVDPIVTLRDALLLQCLSMKEESVTDKISIIANLIEQQLGCWLHEESSRTTPLFVGIQGPQGCGKTTLAHYISQKSPWRVVHLCLDDFYLPLEEQSRLYEHEQRHPLYMTRGHAGTHDIGLILGCLRTLRSAKSGTLRVPVYDKLAHKGRGDRLPIDQWRVIELPVDIVLFEGWMMGFQPKSDPRLLPPLLHTINRYLYDYLPIYTYCDAFIQFQIDDLTWIFRWRREQEHHHRLSRKIDDRSSPLGMTDSEVDDFVEHFLPVYPVYMSEVVRTYPWKRVLIIHLDHERRLLSFSSTHSSNRTARDRDKIDSL